MSRWPARPAFNPASLFAAGQVGAAVLPGTAYGSVYQETTGASATTPSAVDDPVGTYRDLINSRNLVAGADAARPLFKQDAAGKYYLLGDGVDDILKATFGSTLAQPWERISVVQVVSWTASDVIFSGGSGTAGALQQFGTSPNVRIHDGTGVTTVTPLPLSKTVILRERHQGASGQMQIYPDILDTVSSSTGTTGTDGLALFANPTPANYGNARVYGVIQRAGTFTAAEVSQIVPYLASLAGIEVTRDYFAEDGCTTPTYAHASYPPAAYNSRTNKTWFCWEAGRPGSATRTFKVNVYNHTTGQWSGVYTIATNPLTNDDHGAPTLVHLDDDRVAVFGGAHNGNMRYSVTTNADDPSAWTALGTITGSYSYPHPNLVGGALYLFMRANTVASSLDLYLRKTSSISGTTLTFDSEVEIVNFGVGYRCYNFKNVVVGTKIHMIMTRADYDDTVRENVYFMIYDTVTGEVANLAGTHSQAPAVSLADMDTYYKIADTTVGAKTNVDFCWDTADANLLHVSYITGGNTVYCPFNSAVAGSETIIAASPDPFVGMAMVPQSGGGCEIWFATDAGAAWAFQGGDAKRVFVSAAGAVGTAETMLAATAYGLGRFYSVCDGHADAVIGFSELGQDETTEIGLLKNYAHGTSRFLSRGLLQ
jgi:hypothetical protein